MIIGIGSADFSGMKFLDDNSGDIDNVQCGELNKHKSDPNSLPSATLDEIPNQLEKYFIRHNIMQFSAVETASLFLHIKASSPSVQQTKCVFECRVL